MKKLVFLFIFPIFLFANIPLSKKQLLTKAKKGDVSSIVLLNKYYNFPETKEGLNYFKKWYKTILKKKKKEDILEFAKIYTFYNSMFVNGPYKSIELLKLVSKSNDSNTLFELLKFLTKINKDNWSYGFKINKKFYLYVRDKFINNKLENVEKLYSYYSNEKIFEEKRQLIYLAEEKYKNAYFFKLKNLEDLYHKDTTKSENIKQRNKILNSIIKTKDLNKILITSKKILSTNYYPYIDAVKLLNVALTINKKDPEIYLLFASIYKNGDNKGTVQTSEKERRYYLEKASKLNSYLASNKLLDDYFYIQHPQKEDYKKYFKIKKLLLSTSNGKKVLANKYYKKNKKDTANDILNSLANKGDEESMMILASRTGYRTFQLSNPEEYELSTKWKNHILNSKNLYLIRKFKKYLISKGSNNYNDILFKIYKQEFANNNLLSFYNSFTANEFRSKIAIKDLEKAAQMGDNTSLHKLASIYAKNKDTRALDIYENLAKENDAKALYTLAGFYETGFLNIKIDTQKALKYYKKAYEITKYKLAASSLARIFKHGTINIKPDLEKSKIWEKRAQKE